MTRNLPARAARPAAGAPSASRRSTKRPTERSTERATERPTERATERPTERATGRSTGRSTRRSAPILAVSGPSGSGKTRLLRRLILALRARGLEVAVLKHTGHPHSFDARGKDTERLRRAGAVAAAIQGPHGMALFGPPLPSARALARLLPPCDLVLAEGWRSEPLPRLEVHRRRVSPEFLCATDRRILAVVSDEAPPRPLPWFRPDEAEAVAGFVVELLGLRPARPAPPAVNPVTP